MITGASLVRKATEHDIQSAFIEYANIRAAEDLIWGNIFAIPNGGFRHYRTAQKLKREGVRPGCSLSSRPIPGACRPCSTYGAKGS